MRNYQTEGRSELSKVCLNSDLGGGGGESEFGSLGKIEEELRANRSKEDQMRKDRLLVLANENDRLKLAVEVHVMNEGKYQQEVERLEKELIFQKRKTAETERRYTEELEKYGGNFGLIETLKRKNSQLQQSTDIKLIELERQIKELLLQVDSHKQSELTLKVLSRLTNRINSPGREEKPSTSRRASRLE